jgi:hypothetical protein
MRTFVLVLGLVVGLAVHAMGEEIRIDERVTPEQMATLPFRDGNIGMPHQESPETDGQATSSCQPTDLGRNGEDFEEPPTTPKC